MMMMIMMMVSLKSSIGKNHLDLLQLQFKMKVQLIMLEASTSSKMSDSVKQQQITHLLFSPSVTVKKQEKITESLVRYIAKDILPLSSIDGTGFVEFMRVVSPNYEIPCRNIIKKRILGLYMTEKNRVARDIKSINCIALTTDYWTSRTTESYI
jgi:hypothetical protein